MNELTHASLAPNERRAIDRLIELLRAEFGSDLRGVWLYGSRARGEQTGGDSDIDLLVISSRGRPNDDLRAIELALEASDAEGVNLAGFSVKVYDPELVAQRREIRSFFMQEVDRDKIVLVGEP